MDIRMLGPFEVRDAGGESVSLGGVKQRAVLAMLVLRANEVVSIDFLADGLWGDAPPDRATNVVQVYVSRLRRSLIDAQQSHPGVAADDLLQRRKPGYMLTLDPGCIDLNRFEGLAREGHAVIAVDPERATSVLGRALDLWRGQPLAEFADMPFARAQIPRLEEFRLVALTTRFRADLLLGRHAVLVGELEMFVSTHPLHEGLREQLITALYRSGRQAEALEACRVARRDLADELGIDPGPALQDIEAAVFAHDPKLDWTPFGLPLKVGAQEPSGAPTPRLPEVWNVPPRNPHFTGRAGALQQLHQRFHERPGTVVLQALYGLGGVGKTQLALEYAHRFAADYDLVWWVDTEQTALIPPQLVSLSRWLSIPNTGLAVEVIRRVVAELGRRGRWLLIFDNAASPADVVAYLPGGAGHVLVTSRTPDWGALGGRLEVDVLARADTVALLRSRIPTAAHDVLEELAAELGDLPLAAAQAAAYLEQTALEPSDYLRRFRSHRADMLTRGDVLGYQGRVDTAWALSLEQLRRTNPAAVALLELGAFLSPDPIPLSLFLDHPDLLGEPLRSAVVDRDALADVVGAAVGFSLVRRRGDSFQMHRLVQAAIRHHLTPTDQRTISGRVVTLLAAAHPGDPSDPENWPALLAIAPHVLATASLGSRNTQNRQLVLAMCEYLGLQGDMGAMWRIAEGLLERWRRELGPDHPDSLLAAATVSIAFAWLGSHEQALTLAMDTLDGCRRILGPEHHDTLRIAAYLTLALMWQGSTRQAHELGQNTLRSARRTLGVDHPTTLLSATGAVFALAWLGESEQATTIGQDTLQRARRLYGPNNHETLRIASAQAFALAGLGELEQARALGQDTFERSQTNLGSDHRTTLIAAATLTFVLTVLGESEHAKEIGQETLHRSRTILGPDQLITLVAAAAYSLTLAELGDIQEAVSLASTTLQRSKQIFGDDHLITITLKQVLVLATPT